MASLKHCILYTLKERQNVYCWHFKTQPMYTNNKERKGFDVRREGKIIAEEDERAKRTREGNGKESRQLRRTVGL